MPIFSEHVRSHPTLTCSNENKNCGDYLKICSKLKYVATAPERTHRFQT